MRNILCCIEEKIKVKRITTTTTATEIKQESEKKQQSQPEMLFTKDTKRRGKQNTASILCLFQLQ